MQLNLLGRVGLRSAVAAVYLIILGLLSLSVQIMVLFDHSEVFETVPEVLQSDGIVLEAGNELN